MVEKLGSVHPSNEEDDETVIEEGLIQDAVSACRFNFFGKLLTNKWYNIYAMKESLRRAWGWPKDLRIVEVDSNLFHFKFDTERVKLLRC